MAISIKELLTRPVRLPRLGPYVPDADDPAIFWFNSEREDVIREITERIVEQAGKNPKRLELALNEVAFHEVSRLERQKDSETTQMLGTWRRLLKRVGRMSDGQKRSELRKISHRMATDVAGNFDPRVYNFATAIVPQLLGAVMRPRSVGRGVVGASGLGRLPIDELLLTEGETPLLRHLAKIGTLVYVPTHSSNLDSIVLGYALHREGLPPVVYGAGKNLFTNPIISFFMHNLGAYRVDRRVRARLYKDVLKTYSTVMIERGYHSLFFPGGTRSRSGMIERHLKLGLAGTAVEAFARTHVMGVRRPVWFVPVTINYSLVLEAESLIEDHLKERGQVRYIIEDDEFSQIDRWVSFLQKLTDSGSACVIRFGRPMDAFGNEVDEEGRTLSPGGMLVDPATYIYRHGKPVLDAERDAAYTREVGRALLRRYEEETVLMGTQIFSHVLFRELVKQTPGQDLFARVRARGEVSIDRQALRVLLGETRDRLIELEDKGRVRLSAFSRSTDIDEFIERGTTNWSGYHTRPMVSARGDQVVLEDPRLTLFYQNRLIPFATDIADEAHLPAAREIHILGASV